MRRSAVRLLAAAAVLALVGAACTMEEEPKAEETPPPVEETTREEAPSAETGAADLRAALETLLQEHVYLAGSATGAALGGRTGEFEAAAAAVDENSVALGDAVGSVYGEEAGTQFLELWRSHIGFFVDYTTGVAKGDTAAQDKAVEDLTQYTQDFGAFLASANPNLTKEAVADLVLEHVLTLKDVVDGQAAGRAGKAYAALRQAAGHMTMIARPLAGAIVAQFPEKFTA